MKISYWFHVALLSAFCALLGAYGMLRWLAEQMSTAS